MEIKPDSRQGRILLALVREYIRTGEPVGSRTISKMDRFDISAATIRNIMSDLEDAGFVHQPHTSAGRVPTDKGYRLFVNSLGGRRNLSRNDESQIALGMVQLAGEINDMMQGISRLLSSMSRHVWIVLGPDHSHILFQQMEFILLAPGRILAVMISPSGVINNRVIEIDSRFDQEDLDAISRFLAERYNRWAVTAVRDDINRLLEDETAEYGELMADALLLGKAYFQKAEDLAEIYLDGASNILMAPEFARVEKIQALLRAIEEKECLISLLNSRLDREDVSIVIGSESEIDDFDSCSIIASRFNYAGRAFGSVGILGPKRMEYPRLISLVEGVAGQVSGLMNQKGIPMGNG